MLILCVPIKIALSFTNEIAAKLDPKFRRYDIAYAAKHRQFRVRATHVGRFETFEMRNSDRQNVRIPCPDPNFAKAVYYDRVIADYEIEGNVMYVTVPKEWLRFLPSEKTKAEKEPAREPERIDLGRIPFGAREVESPPNPPKASEPRKPLPTPSPYRKMLTTRF